MECTGHPQHEGCAHRICACAERKRQPKHHENDYWTRVRCGGVLGSGGAPIRIDRPGESYSARREPPSWLRKRPRRARLGGHA